MKNLKIFLVLTSLLFFTDIGFAWATRVIGAEMSYKWVSGNTFSLELTVYRDCGSQLAIGNRQRIYYSSFSCRPTQDSINMVQVGLPEDITPICKREPSTCNGGTGLGIQKYRYAGSITLPGKCTDWVFYFRLCNRSSAINTILNPQSNCIYIESRLNNLTSPTNNSSKINNDPISYLCKGQFSEINPGIIDIDGDRIKVEMVAPRTNSIIPNVVDLNVVQYADGFSATNPLSNQNGFGFDTSNGTLKFTPNQEQIGQVALRVSEFKSGRFVGSTMIDFPILIRSCANATPFLAGFNNGPSQELLVCVGDSLNTNIVATDTNQTDTLRMNWSNKPSDAEFTTKKGKGTSFINIRWSPTVADTGNRTFTVTVDDDRCPVVASSTKTYTLKVRLKPEIRTAGDTFVACGVIVPIFATVTKGLAPYAYSWTGRTNTTQTIVVGHGTYVARVTDATGCFAEDTIKLKGSSISGSITVDTSCLVEGVQLTGVPVSSNTGITYKMEWTFPPENQTFVGATIRRRFQTSGNKNVILKITGSDSCTITIIRQIKVCDPPPVVAQFAPNVCLGKPLTVGVGSVAASDVCQTSKIEFYLIASNWLLFPTIGSVTLPPDSLRPDSNTFRVTTFSPNNCKNQKEFKFKVRPSPGISLVPDVQGIQFNCLKPDTTILIKIFKDFRFINDSIWGQVELPDTILKIPKSKQDTIRYPLKLNKPGVITIKALIDGNCSETKSFSYLPLAQASVSVSKHCKATDSVTITPFFPSQRFKNFTIDLGNGNQSVDSTFTVFYQPNGLYNGFFRVEDSLGCKDTTEFTVDTRLPDSTVITNGDTICKDAIFKFRIQDTTLVSEWKFRIIGLDFILNNKKMEDSLPLGFSGQNPVDISIKFKQGCTRNWSIPSRFVRQPVIPKLTMNNVCAYDSSRFQGAVTFSEFPVKSWNWKYFYPPGVNLPFSEDSVQNPVRLFNYNGKFRSIFTVENIKGCLGKDTLDSNLVLITKPLFAVNGNCQNDSLIFFVGDVLDIYENIERYTYVYTDSSLESTGNGQGLFQFKEPGVYQVSLIAYSIEGCANKDTNTLEIKPRPKAVFSIPPPEICQNQKMILDGRNSKPAAPDQKLTSFVWASSYENPISSDSLIETSISDVGSAYFALQVKSTNGCQDYLKIPLTIRPRPQADFLANEADLQRGDRISFQDLSIGGTSWKWDFGDGTTDFITDSSQSSPNHKYSFGRNFSIKQWVSNDFGCADSTTKEVNLKSFIALPGAFSPNGDERNDDCKLLHRLIKELKEFKIYNRWGQIVFDGGSNLDSKWNGTIDGIQQPNGNYLYIAKAISVFGENLELKGSITLIR